MDSPDNIAEAFQQLDFHDDTFGGVTVVPPQVRNDGTGSAVDVRLLRNGDETGRAVRFIGCTNLRIAMDFDVLAGNLPPNTSGGEAHSDADRLREFMQSQQMDWGVTYGSQAISPLDKKMAEMDALVFFRVQLFGGVIEVVARNYSVLDLAPSAATQDD